MKSIRSFDPARRHLAQLMTALAIMGSLALTACGGTSSASGRAVSMAPMSDMPAQVQSAPVTVQQAYQFATANPELLRQIPCYCGCGAMGHTSNYDCYVSGVDSGGKPTFDTHALGCGICVDITQDAIRLAKQGKPVAEIRAYVDQTYSKFGPSNMR